MLHLVTWNIPMTLNQPILKATNPCSNSSNDTHHNISKLWCHFHSSSLAYWAERREARVTR